MKVIVSIVAILFAISCNSQEVIEEYHINGDIKRKFIVDSEGIKIGFDSIFYPKGKLKEFKIWKRGSLTDSIIRFSKSGEIISIGTIANNELVFRNKRNGLTESIFGLNGGVRNGLGIYFTDGIVRSVGGYQDNSEDGILISLKKEGGLKFIKQIDSKENYGLTMKFFSDGKPKDLRVATKENHGYTMSFHKNGHLKDVGLLKNGKAHGTKFHFSNIGVMLRKSFFKEGNEIWERE